MGERALLVIDVQNDFCAGGALAVPDGDAVVPVLNAYMKMFHDHGQLICATRDWHPRLTRHFKGRGGVWPAHCVQNTPGADFHPDLRLPPGAIIITKGDRADVDAYSAFDGHDERGRRLLDILRQAGVNELYVGGLATDYCVKATVVEQTAREFAVFLLVDAVRGVERKPGDVREALRRMRDAGVKETVFSQVQW